MKIYEVTYKAPGVKYDCSYIVSADDAAEARIKTDAWAKQEHPTIPKFVSIKKLIEVTA